MNPEVLATFVTGHLGLIAIILVLMVAPSLIEQWMAFRWRPGYFRAGIPIYRREVRLKSRPELTEGELNGRSWGILIRKKMKFRKIGNAIAFKPARRGKKRPYGVLEPLEGRRGFRITARINWSVAIGFFVSIAILYLAFLLFIEQAPVMKENLKKIAEDEGFMMNAPAIAKTLLALPLKSLFYIIVMLDLALLLLVHYIGSAWVLNDLAAYLAQKDYLEEKSPGDGAGGEPSGYQSIEPGKG